MVKYFLLIFVFIMFFAISVVPVNAQVFYHSGIIGGIPLSYGEQLGFDSKYVRVEVKASSSNASYKIALIGGMNHDQLSTNNSLGTSLKKFTGNKKYIIYILPRAGKNCPNDADYCFGKGRSMTSTLITENGDCTYKGNATKCNLYGIRIINSVASNSYNVSLSYEFLN